MVRKNSGDVFDTIEGFKDRISKLQRSHERSKGSYDNQIQHLKLNYGVTSLDSARRLLGTKQKKKDKLEAQLKKSTEDFEKRYGKYLEDNDGESC
jgi:Sec-independent protein translocase protein TatA